MPTSANLTSTNFNFGQFWSGGLRPHCCTPRNQEHPVQISFFLLSLLGMPLFSRIIHLPGLRTITARVGTLPCAWHVHEPLENRRRQHMVARSDAVDAQFFFRYFGAPNFSVVRSFFVGPWRRPQNRDTLPHNWGCFFYRPTQPHLFFKKKHGARVKNLCQFRASTKRGHQFQVHQCMQSRRVTTDGGPSTKVQQRASDGSGGQDHTPPALPSTLRSPPEDGWLGPGFRFGTNGRRLRPRNTCVLQGAWRRPTPLRHAAQCRQRGQGTPTWCQGRAAPPPSKGRKAFCGTQIKVSDRDVGRDPCTCFTAHLCRSHLFSEVTSRKQTPSPPLPPRGRAA